MKKRPSITLLTVLLAMVFAAGIGVYSSYIGMKIYQESSDHLLESFSQISETFTLFVQRNWTVLSQWDGQLKNADIAHADSIGADMQNNKESWHYSDFYLFNESTQYLTADGRKGSVDSISGVIQEMYSEGGPIVSTYTASYGVPKIVFAMPLSRNMTLDGVTYTGLAVSYDTDVVDDLVDGSMYGGKSDCYIVRTNGDIVLALEPQTELCEGMTNLYDIDAHADWIYGSMDDIRDCVQLGRSGSAQFICQGGRNYLVAIPTAFPDGALSTLSTGWYQLTDGVRREVTLPAALETGPGQTITLYNDTLTDSDGGKVLSARGVEYGIEIRAGETLLYRYEDNAFPKNAQMKGRLWADTELPYGIGGQTLSLTFTELPGRMPYRRARPRLGAGRHRPTYPVLAVLRRHDTRHARARRARAADLPLHELLRHPRAPLSRHGGLSAAVQPVVPDRFRPVSALRCRHRRRERRFLLRLHDHGHPDGAFRPQHGQRQAAARSRCVHRAALRQRPRTGRGADRRSGTVIV